MKGDWGGFVGTINPCYMGYPICPLSPKFNWGNYIKWLKDNEDLFEVSYVKSQPGIVGSPIERR